MNTSKSFSACVQEWFRFLVMSTIMDVEDVLDQGIVHKFVSTGKELRSGGYLDNTLMFTFNYDFDNGNFTFTNVDRKAYIYKQSNYHSFSVKHFAKDISTLIIKAMGK